MPRKKVSIFHTEECLVCKSRHFYKNGNCMACVTRLKREEAAKLALERPKTFEISSQINQNVKSDEFKKRAAKYWEGCDFR